jgi:D-aminoacyl-tRNA deacylase
VFELTPQVLAVRRPGRHVYDEALATLLPPELTGVPIVFPSIHRSEKNLPCFTVHPLGNFGDRSDVGGRPRTLNPAPARLMADALRRCGEAGRAVGLPATFEATHHGPALPQPSCFVEIGFGTDVEPPVNAVRELARLLLELTPSADDRIAVGVGGGHYAPHFTDLVLKRQWSFGHMIPRYALEGMDREVAHSAIEKTPGCEGIVFARQEDARASYWETVGRKLRDADAPIRAGSARSSGT